MVLPDVVSNKDPERFWLEICKNTRPDPDYSLGAPTT